MLSPKLDTFDYTLQIELPCQNHSMIIDSINSTIRIYVNETEFVKDCLQEDVCLFLNLLFWRLHLHIRIPLGLARTRYERSFVHS